MKQTGISHHFSNHWSVLHILIPVSFIYFSAIKGVFCNLLNRHTNMYTRSSHNVKTYCEIQLVGNLEKFSYIQLVQIYSTSAYFSVQKFALVKLNSIE